MNRSLLLILLFMPMALFAQEGFGFGDSDFGFEDSDFGFGGSASSLQINIGGEVQAELKAFTSDFDSKEKVQNVRLGDIFSGRLKFEAAGPSAQGIIDLKILSDLEGDFPVEIDEAFLRAFFGTFTVEGGIRKLSWGKADSFGPLDVVNPLDYRDLTKLHDPQSIKIARPMVHTIWSIGSFSKLEAVFVPYFQGHRFAASGVWAPRQMTELAPALVGRLKTAMLGRNPGLSLFFPTLDEWQNNFNVEEYYIDSNQTLRYAQAGTRFTTSFGSSDFGIQYYFGRLPRPRVTINTDDYVKGLMSFPPVSNPDLIFIDIDNNYYHQIGVDFARILAGFNLRAEAGANITKDLDGTDGEVENPFLVWSLGFDRNLIWRINLNLQGTGRVRLFHGRLGETILTDCEAGSDISSTRITGIISRKFFQDELELKASGLWGIEDRDFLVMPAVAWSRSDVKAELSAGFFGGDREGELGQYRDNAFVRIMLSYKF